MRIILIIGMLFVGQCFAQDDNEIYEDIMSRASETALVTKYDRLTNVHETIHKMCGEHRVSLKPSFGRNSFYIPQPGYFITFNEPNIKKSDVKSYIPVPLRGNRYKLYIEGSPWWNDAPLYIFDEWNAYLAEDECYIIDHYIGTHKLPVYADVSSSLEFSVYSVALYNAIQDKDPQYFLENPEFEDFVYLQLYRTSNVVQSAMKIGMYSSLEKQRAYHKNMLESPIGTTLRSKFRGVLAKID